LGLAASTALFYFFHPSIVLGIAFVGVFAFVLRAYGPANYGILAIGVTGLVVFLFAVTGVSPSEVVMARGWNTLIGGAVALLGYRLWPTWERTQTPEAVARMLDAYGAYGRAVAAAYLNQGRDGGAELEKTRLAARVARFNLEASLGRMRAEPGSSPERIAAFDRILADSHRLVHAVMSLEAGLLASSPVPSRAPFQALAHDVDRTLYFLSAGLRGSRIRHTDFPDLREDHHKLTESGDPNIPRYALSNVETDRIVNSLNTLTGDILPLVDAGLT
jgi:uncharacterized membrane protein YccC